MTSIHKEVSLSATPAAVLDVVRNVAAVHTRLAPGFVTDTVMDGPDRIVTFADGLVGREMIRGGPSESRDRPGRTGRRRRGQRASSK